MTKLHQDLLDELQKSSGRGTAHSASDSYLSSGHLYHDISVPARRTIAKNWIREHGNEVEIKEFIGILDELFASNYYEEKTMGSMLLDYLPKLRHQVPVSKISFWMNELVGWAEVDSLCQNVFTHEELHGHWKDWEKFLEKLATDKNINKRRASLVFLTGPVTYSTDHKFSKLAFKNIDLLKGEKDILITKAISWLLRSMVKNHKEGVEEYVRNNLDTLPKIALRETRSKLRTGKK